MTRKHAKVVFVFSLGIGILLMLSSLYSFAGIVSFRNGLWVTKIFFRSVHDILCFLY